MHVKWFSEQTELVGNLDDSYLKTFQLGVDCIHFKAVSSDPHLRLIPILDSNPIACSLRKMGVIVPNTQVNRYKIFRVFFGLIQPKCDFDIAFHSKKFKNEYFYRQVTVRLCWFRLDYSQPFWGKKK